MRIPSSLPIRALNFLVKILSFRDFNSLWNIVSFFIFPYKLKLGIFKPSFPVVVFLLLLWQEDTHSSRTLVCSVRFLIARSFGPLAIQLIWTVEKETVFTMFFLIFFFFIIQLSKEGNWIPGRCIGFEGYTFILKTLIKTVKYLTLNYTGPYFSHGIQASEANLCMLGKGKKLKIHFEFYPNCLETTVYA